MNVLDEFWLLVKRNEPESFIPIELHTQTNATPLAPQKPKRYWPLIDLI